MKKTYKDMYMYIEMIINHKFPFTINQKYLTSIIFFRFSQERTGLEALSKGRNDRMRFDSLPL